MDINSLLSEALENLTQKKFDDAIKQFNKIIEINPNSIEAYLWRAKCYETWMVEDKTIPSVGEFGILSPLPKNDYRLKEAIKSYEKAVELSSYVEDRGIIENVINFFSLGPIEWEIPNKIYDKWLQNHPDDVEVWHIKAETAGIGIISGDREKAINVAIESYKKVIDLIESIYECEDFYYDAMDEKRTRIIKFPNKIAKEHRGILDTALFDFCILLVEEEKNYEEFFKYFWKLLLISEDKIEELKVLTTLFLNKERIWETKYSKKIESLRKETGLDKKQHMKNVLQNSLVDSCINNFGGFIKRKLRERYGESWWDDAIPEDLKNKVFERKSMEKRYPLKPKQEELYYVNIRDFFKIIKNNWKIFENSLESQEFIKKDIIEPLANFRNEVKHNRLLTDLEIKELEVILERIKALTKKEF